MKEAFKNEDALKEEISRLEEENKELLLQFQKGEKLNKFVERTVHIVSAFGCMIFVVMIAVSIIPEGRFIALITASVLSIPAALVSYMFW